MVYNFLVIYSNTVDSYLFIFEIFLFSGANKVAPPGSRWGSNYKRKCTKTKNTKTVLPKYKTRVVSLELPKSVRSYFGDNAYILDANSCGKIERFINHSCDSNMFVQNVFVDTHDIRFPWVAFFANRFIPAGTELAWNYGYVVGSVHGKKIMCHCGTNQCKKRLL